MNESVGKVVKAYGNLLEVEFSGSIRQGAIVFVSTEEHQLKAEVIEINGKIAKIQVFEDTRGVFFGSKVIFKERLLEATLGPGLLGSVYDGLQNPLYGLAKTHEHFLPIGTYLDPINKTIEWEFFPTIEVNSKVKRGDSLGYTNEKHIKHYIMVPFELRGTLTVKQIENQGYYTVDDVLVKLENNTGDIVEVKMIQNWPVKSSLIEGSKQLADDKMSTGLRIIDTQFPVAKGGTFCTPGPFGAGKTVLQHHLSKYSDVDIVILAACGERAGEVVEVIKEFPELDDPKTGKSLMDRTIMICNTSSMPVAARESSVYLGVTLGEYYRQMGYNVLLLADSTSRWAQAMREMSGRLEEIPGDEAFPAYLSSRIAEFYQRSGCVKLNSNLVGSLTIGGAVSPAGGNFEEPVTQATLAVVGAFLGLSRERSDSRRYPAIDPMISWSKYAERMLDTSNEESIKIQKWVKESLGILKKGDEIKRRMEVVGEEGVSIDDLIVHLKAELYDNAYLQQNAFDNEDSYCDPIKQNKLFTVVSEVFDTTFHFQTHDEARTFFLQLQNNIRNLNYTPLSSSEFEKQVDKIIKTLHKLDIEVNNEVEA
jgi:V/A-type H+/Na+-transporting ATPase subunit A